MIGSIVASVARGDAPALRGVLRTDSQKRRSTSHEQHYLTNQWQNTRVPILVRASELHEISSMREKYRKEMNCQIIHDSIHARAGWSREFALHIDDGGAIGYGSVAVAGPWRDNPALYEFFLEPEHRMRTFDAFAALLQSCGARIIETQSNNRLLSLMLHVFARDVRTESILFEDGFETSFRPQGAGFRAATASDAAILQRLELDDTAGWVVTLNDEMAGAGGVLYHYNRPYGDVYMKIAEPFRRVGLGTYLVQELKAVCRTGGSVPSARCNVANEPSRKTLQKAGFVPCGVLISGDLGG
jgi:GNAT superfamily N-acetyltransferase